MAAATTSMVVIAFVVPLGLAVRTIAAYEALHDADVQARSLAAANATVTDGAALADLIRSANATSVGPLSVFMTGVAAAQEARDVARGDRGTRAAPDGPPEMAEVGRAFSLLVSRIGDLLAAEREAAADLSHRLRTPLTALRLDVERMPASSESDRLAAGMVAMERAVTGVIGRMRRRTRDGGRPSTDLAAAVDDRIGFWTELAREQGRELQVSIDHGPAAVALEKDEVETLVDELLTNVFAHTADTTTCRVLVEVPQPDLVRLVVEDDGPGFARELVGRGESGAESSGLGLDIVSRIAEGAGGSLDVMRSRGGGARVEVVLRVSRRSEERRVGKECRAW